MLYILLIISGIAFDFFASLIDFNEYEGKNSDYLQEQTICEQIKDFLKSVRL